MNKLYRSFALMALIGHSIPAAHAQARGYVETDLVVNKQAGSVPTLVDSNGVVHIAKFFDENLANPWGIAESSTSAFWVANGSSGRATLYNTAGSPQPLIVSIPNPADPLGTGGSPSGAVFNTASAQGAFKVTGVKSDGTPVTAPATFLFATKDGTILGWNPNVNPLGFDPAKAGKYAIIAVTTPGAVYTGLAIATDAKGTTRLYAANFAGATVDVFDTDLKPAVSSFAFVDAYLPSGYAPFNIAPITVDGTTRMFVMYALNDLTQLVGQGHGIVNTFDLDGSQPRRFAQHGQLNGPWGIVLTPPSFGALGGTLWIGNFGNGHINAFDPATGQQIGKVRTPGGKIIVIDGLWTLRFGNGGNGGSMTTLYFTAGPNREQDGLFGAIDPQ